MLNLGIDLIAVAFVLGIMILVHEFGHYAAAKWFGVRVEVFSIGFGKRLFGFRRGDTDYRISALPLGGYVKMSGENPMDKATGDPAEFTSHPRWQRFIIAFAGPFMNIVLAVALLTGVFMFHYEHPIWLDQPATVGWVLEDSAASRAGLQVGDRIVRIENTQNPTWEDVLLKGFINPGQAVSIAVQRGDQIISTSVTPERVGPQEIGDIGLVPAQPNRITAISKDMPAYQAGIRLGDEIVAVDGTTVRSIPGMANLLQKNGDKQVEITVVRSGQEMKFQLTPRLDATGGEKRYRIGIQADPTHVDKLPFVQAFRQSIATNKRYSFLIIELVQKLIQRKVPLKQVDGPLSIMRASGEAAREEGWTPLLKLMAIISLNLGVFNLFPIPIMDGGVILLLAIEGLMRRDISMKIKERIYQAAFVFLIIFAAVVIYNDITKLPGLGKFLP